MGKLSHTKLKEYQGKMKQQEMEEILVEVRHCQLSDMYDKSLKRITVAARDNGMVLVLADAFKQMGLERKVNNAPVGALEHQLQLWLESMQ